MRARPARLVAHSTAPEVGRPNHSHSTAARGFTSSTGRSRDLGSPPACDGICRVLRRDGQGVLLARPGLTGHRKFRRLARALGSPILARGALELMWESCYESGDDYMGTATDIESVVEWTGVPGALVQALIDAGKPEGHGFIEPVYGIDKEPTYRAHDLWSHAPRWAKVKRYKRLWRACGLGDPSGWVATRIRVLARDGRRCRYCGDYADTVDHVIPRVKGGTHDDSNLVAACRSCNSRKQDRAVAEAGMALRSEPDIA